MKSSQFLNEGDDKNIDDVQANHLVIYRFMVERLGYMALNKQSTVEAYNTANSHMVVIKIKPSAGLGNTKAGLESDGVAYESMKSPMDGSEVLSGVKGALHWTVSNDNVRGNSTATWRFAMPHANDETQYYTDRTMEEDVVDEGDVETGDFGAKGGPKPQIQNAEPISMAQAFGSEAYNVLANAGIKFHEKPSYWSDLERSALGEHGQKRVEKVLADAGIKLEEYPAWQLYPIDDMDPDDYVRGPLQTVENMPEQKVFIIYDLPYSDLRHGVQDPRVGTFLVDRQGASSYIRFWRQIS